MLSPGSVCSSRETCSCKTPGPLLVEREAGNFSSPAYPGLIVKDSYWRWPQRNWAGNAIDFHLQVLGLSFHDAMRQTTGT